MTLSYCEIQLVSCSSHNFLVQQEMHLPIILDFHYYSSVVSRLFVRNGSQTQYNFYTVGFNDRGRNGTAT